jgi:hypothetical protein
MFKQVVGGLPAQLRLAEARVRVERTDDIRDAVRRF